MRTLVFGDIHGCLNSLETVWQAVCPAEDDHIIFLGDYVDRGPSSRQVIDFVIEKSKSHKITRLTGNHEEKFLLSRIYTFEYAAWVDRWDATATMESYGITDVEDVPEAHWEFLRTCKPYYETSTHIFVHATLEYDTPLLEQQPYTIIHKKLGNPECPHISGKTVICGHTAQKNHLPLNLGHTICIDTDAGRNGYVTCLDVDSGKYWQGNEEKEMRTGFL